MARAVAGIGEFLEAEIGRNIHEIKRNELACPQENATGENSADSLGMLFLRVTERSTHEIENLIDQLHSLRMKLEADSGLIEQAFAEHSRFSQGAMQLATIIADNVKRLPQPAS
jgi:hypothetical protein